MEYPHVTALLQTIRELRIEQTPYPHNMSEEQWTKHVALEMAKAIAQGPDNRFSVRETTPITQRAYQFAKQFVAYGENENDGWTPEEIKTPVYDNLTSKLKALEVGDSETFCFEKIMSMLCCGPGRVEGKLVRLIDDLYIISKKRFTVTIKDRAGNIEIMRTR